MHYESKTDHPRVGDRTEVALPEEPVIYGEFTHGATTVMYHSDEYPNDKVGYMVSTSFHSRENGWMYRHSEDIDEETAHQILDDYNDGYWGYVE